MSGTPPSPPPSAPQRFAPEQHLRRAGDFRRVREGGRRIDSGALTVWWRRRDAASGLAPSRVGVVASSAAVGPAVRRNAAKRRLREIFRRNQVLVPTGIDLILVARAALNRLRYQVVESQFADACRRIATSNDERR